MSVEIKLLKESVFRHTQPIYSGVNLPVALFGGGFALSRGLRGVEHVLAGRCHVNGAVAGVQAVCFSLEPKIPTAGGLPFRVPLFPIRHPGCSGAAAAGL